MVYLKECYPLLQLPFPAVNLVVSTKTDKIAQIIIFSRRLPRSAQKEHNCICEMSAIFTTAWANVPKNSNHSQMQEQASSQQPIKIDQGDQPETWICLIIHFLVPDK